MKIKTITDYLETFAPLSIQEDYDNAGLLVGSQDTEAKGAMVTLDVTEEVIDEAIQQDCNLIIAHHPIIFKGIKRLNGGDHVQRSVIKAIKNDIAIYAAHTNLDHAHVGVNAKISEQLGLQNAKVLRPISNIMKKLVTYCPDMKSDSGAYYPGTIRQALFEEGAGEIGPYDLASYNIYGRGTFRPTDDQETFAGSKKRMHVQQEVRIEVAFPGYLKNRIIKRLMETHPYRHVVYDVYPLEATQHLAGAGMIGKLEKPVAESEFLKQVKSTMLTDCVRHSPLRNKQVEKVAVCGGAGSFLLQDAIDEAADAFVSSDFKYHQFFDADQNLLIADIGHFESERFTIDLLYDWLKEKFSTFAVYKSNTNTNPISYL